MSIWRVRVRGLHDPGEGKDMEFCYEECLVEAENGGSAMKAGRQFIENTARTDVRWHEFMSLMATKIQLPIKL